INTLLGINLLPIVLFEYRNIQSLAAHLVATYPSKIDALSTAGQPREQSYSGEQRQIQPPSLTPLPRKKHFSGRLAPFPQERTNATTLEGEISDRRTLDKVWWQEASLDDSYEKVTF